MLKPPSHLPGNCSSPVPKGEVVQQDQKSPIMSWIGVGSYFPMHRSITMWHTPSSRKTFVKRSTPTSLIANEREGRGSKQAEKSTTYFPLPSLFILPFMLCLFRLRSWRQALSHFLASVHSFEMCARFLRL